MAHQAQNETHRNHQSLAARSIAEEHRVCARSSPEDITAQRASAEDSWRPLPLEEIRRQHIRRVLDACEGSRVRAAQLLGMSRTSLYRFLKRSEKKLDGAATHLGLLAATDALTGLATYRGLSETLEGGSVILGQIVSELKKERNDLNRAIAALEGIGARRSLKRMFSEKGSTAQPSTNHRRGLSAAARRRISEAMKKRWAERRSKVTPLRESANVA